MTKETITDPIPETGAARSANKLCQHCQEWKPLQEFRKRSGRKAGVESRRGTCKRCTTAMSGANRAAASSPHSAANLPQSEEKAVGPDGRQQAKPQAVDPQQRKPKADSPQQAKPQAGSPQQAKPEADSPGRAKPQSGSPQQAKPEADSPRRAAKRKRGKRRRKAAGIPGASTAPHLFEAGAPATTSSGASTTADSDAPTADKRAPAAVKQPAPAAKKSSAAALPIASRVPAAPIASRVPAAAKGRQHQSLPRTGPSSGLNASALKPDRSGVIRMRGKTDKGKGWTQDTDLETAVTLVQQHAAVVVNRHTIRRLYTNQSFRKYIRSRDRNKCYFCGREGTTIDHLVPRAKGGHTTPVNCVLACEECNRIKADRDLADFMDIRRRRSDAVQTLDS